MSANPQSSRNCLSRELSRTAETVAMWLSESPRVLIGAGAGLSVAAGIDYGDVEDFARRFPALVRRGLTARYQLIGYAGLEDRAFWGYWAAHVADVRFSDRLSAVYTQLRELVAEKDYFVLTSNVDAMFVRHGFDSKRVCSIQGDYAYLQCVGPCTNEVWPTRPVIDKLLPTIDSASQEVTDPAVIPSCPHCGGPVFMNVRAGSWFLETPYLASLNALRTWLNASPGSPLLVFDIGSGFNTPTVVRWPMERIASAHPDARLVRINVAHPDVPGSLAERALGIGAGAAETIEAIRNVSV